MIAKHQIENENLKKNHIHCTTRIRLRKKLKWKQEGIFKFQNINNSSQFQSLAHWQQLTSFLKLHLFLERKAIE